MKTCTSISGGRTSAYLAANYPTDYNVFALVRTDDPACKFPDEKLRQAVEDRIQKPFIGTLEDDVIINTIFDLEQHIGRRIDWVSGRTFDEITQRGDKVYLPNKVQRFCTIEMKIEPIFYWWAEHIGEPIETQIGFRANEMRRAKNMLARCNSDGLTEFKATFEKHKDGRNKWVSVPYQKPSFPLIADGIFKDNIDAYWKDKGVRFAWMNNCVGCFHKQPLLLKKMFEKHPNKLEWFAQQEDGRDRGDQWRPEVKYRDILKAKMQIELSFDDFSECDSGYCGL